MEKLTQIPDIKKEYLWIVEDILKEAAKENINRFFVETIRDAAKDCYQEEISEDTIVIILNYYEHLGYLKMKILYNPHYPNPKTEMIVDTIGDLPREAPLAQCYPIYFLDSDFIKHQQKIVEKERDEKVEQKFNFKTEMQPVQYIQLNGKWYKCRDVVLAISDILNPFIKEKWIKQSKLIAPLSIYYVLVKMGLIKRKRIDEYETDFIYCIAEGAEVKLQKMRTEIYEYLKKAKE